MKILVLVKNVPEAAEADLEVDSKSGTLETGDLVYSINEWDNYALEEAVRLKESRGGEVTVLTLGDEEAEDVLRRGLAMGADRAVHLLDEAFEGSDPRTVAKAVARAVQGQGFDLILAGVQSSDLAQAQTGVLLAQELDLPFATLAVGLEIREGRAEVTRELEANTLERVELPLPALVTIQSGINQPRYVSIMGIRKVRRMTVDLRDCRALGLTEEEVGPGCSFVQERRLLQPPAGQGATMLEGSLPEACRTLAGIIKDRGGL